MARDPSDCLTRYAEVRAGFLSLRMQCFSTQKVQFAALLAYGLGTILGQEKCSGAQHKLFFSEVLNLIKLNVLHCLEITNLTLVALEIMAGVCGRLKKESGASRLWFGAQSGQPTLAVPEPASEAVFLLFIVGFYAGLIPGPNPTHPQNHLLGSRN